MKHAFWLSALLLPATAVAQEHGGHGAHGAHTGHSEHMPTPDAETAASHGAHAGQDGHDLHQMQGHEMAMPAGSGTSLLPLAEGGMPAFHLSSGDWMVMAHGVANLTYTDQGGPRGGERKAFLQSMAMLMAQRDFGGATLDLRAMGSLEPAMGRRGYPNLFATGETANGVPLVDRQHPHDLFMELSARVTVPVSDSVSAFVYGGPVGEPALGPSAFMHRASARYLALSPIAHHWFDSTHITYGVVTAGVRTRALQLEASAFKGREPDEERWGLDKPKLDSWSIRASWTPTENWVVQASHGRLKEPEAMHGKADERRTTASVQYGSKDFSAMLAFAAKERLPGATLHAWTVEGNWNVAPRHSLFGRMENVENDELFPDHSHPLHDTKFQVTRFEAGYAHRIPLRFGELALGGSVAAYAKPRALNPYYGKAPVSGTLFARLALGN